MRKIRTIIILATFLLIIGIANIAFGASAYISCNSEIEVNKPIKITVSGTGVQWNLKLMVDGSVVATNSELENYLSNKNISFSYTYTPTSTGTKKISLAGSVTEYSDGSTIVNFGSKSITVTEPVVTPTPEPTPTPTPAPTSSKKPTTTPTETEKKKSSDSTLSALGITEGILAPEFNKDIREYTLDVANEVTALTVNATTADSKASFNIKGNENLQVGENTLTIQVKAEDRFNKQLYC